MVKAIIHRYKTSRRALYSLLAAIMVLTLLGSAPVTAQPAQQAAAVQPILLQMAASHPQAHLNVIVQKTSSDSHVEAAVTRLGGTVTKDLHIINGFAASLPGKAIAELARESGIRYISYDAGMKSATTNPVFTTWATQPGSAAYSSTADNFNSTPINSGRYLWFSAVTHVSGLGSGPTTISTEDAAVTFTANGTNFTVPLPAASIIYSPTATLATTTYDPVEGMWTTTVPNGLAGNNVFLTGLAMQVPIGLPGNVNPVTWSANFTSDTPGVQVSGWKWATAAYSNLSTDLTTLGVKPCDDSGASQYKNSDKAGTPESFKPYVVAGATGGGGSNYVGSYSSGKNVIPAVLFDDADNVLSTPQGPDDSYANGSNVLAAFGGFAAESSPDTSITRVEAVLRAYVPAPLASGDDPVLSVTIGGTAVRTVTLNHTVFNPFVGQLNAGYIYVDMTGSRTWTWADFDNDLQLKIDQTHFNSSHYVYYDAVGLRVTTTDGTDTSGGLSPTSQTGSLIDVNKLSNLYNREVRASDVWNEAPGYFQGQGMTVAVVDSGVLNSKDLKGRVIRRVNFNDNYHNSFDGYGHGTFVAGMVGGDGKLSSGKYVGMAPKVNLVNVRVSDDYGASTESDVVSGLQWILDNKAQYNIRVVNMSLNSSVAESYHQSALDAASEILWFNGIVVVVSAGNTGTANLFPPANDPFVITVGAINDQGTLSLSDDTMAPFSAYGVVENGVAKPELVAPGTRIVGLLPDHGVLTISRQHTSAQVNKNYFRMSGTSMSAPIVSGAVALLLQSNPNLNPDQVKYRLMSTAVKTAGWPGYDPVRAGAGYLDIYAAIHSNITNSANTGTTASQLLWTGDQPINWGSVNWNSVNWNTVNWNTVNWNTVNWNTVNWNSDDWTTP